MPTAAKLNPLEKNATAMLKAFRFNHCVTWSEQRKGGLGGTFVSAVSGKRVSLLVCAVHPCLKARNLNFTTGGSIRKSGKTQRF